MECRINFVLIMQSHEINQQCWRKTHKKNVQIKYYDSMYLCGLYIFLRKIITQFTLVYLVRVFLPSNMISFMHDLNG